MNSRGRMWIAMRPSPGSCNGGNDTTPERAALRDFKPAYVGSGSKSVVGRCPRDVRIAACKRTFVRHRRWSEKCQEATYALQQIAAYSITSSAIASSPGGKLRPNALAVLRLITSSNLVGCMTGRSEGFSPLRMRPVYKPAWRYAPVMLVP